MNSYPLLQHWPYIASMPRAEDILTPLFMHEEELGLLIGTNLYFAALDRKREWKREWERCRAVVERGSMRAWLDLFTLEVRPDVWL